MAKLVLVVDDEKSVCEALKDVLEESGYSVVTATSGREALEKVNLIRPHAVLLDIRMPEMDGIKVLQALREKHPGVPVILMTAYSDTQTTINAMRYGAFEYIVKPINLDELLSTLEKATTVTEPLVTVGKGEIAPRPGTLIGCSPAMQEVYKTIGRIADSDVTVLIQGESGTGKELVAEAIHYNSPRQGKPFVKIDCTAIPENLLESELFGHEKGAFTGAHTRKLGKFELADGGTVFLDEIGDISPALQAKLLRFLQEKAFERVGGTETRRVDVRIIAATNKDLEERVKSGLFREDLYYRLNVVEIKLPPLRERKEDIMLLVDYFVSLSNRKFGKQVTGLTRSVADILLQYNWPGNVRELRNVCERAVLMARGNVITPESLPEYLLRAVRGRTEAWHPAEDRGVLPLKEMVAEMERSAILRALEEYRGNKTAVARALGMSRTTLYAKMKELGIADPENKDHSELRKVFGGH
ncbi:two component, sigma54 specific, transcriptional regulator, Fis family [Ammonifex degensii KC4]|uniref:DNA-binding transcriptional regulator NtrC n=1 Tax=Ammonifex degensii (strain DSM 10501 / KC4) TaxID=429009 RepID=C9RBQ4_AMMDK|nr:sigma-54 dependent transcriptional regulator [Ammonifex degensii]ACX51681.1 two component, sigma54 specific, transcriptional regulator, Fis family [Ammonifex degensii KC4]